MGYRLRADESVTEGVRRIANSEIDKALAEINSDSLGIHETVHQVRKRCKKIRGLLRLVRPGMGKTYSRENAHFRDTARIISGARDVTAMIEAYDALLDRYEAPIDRRAFAPIRRRLSSRQKQLAANEDQLMSKLETVEQALTSARARADSWKVKKSGFKSVRGGLLKTYTRGIKRGEAARKKPTDERLHEWRKRVKYHWYHLRLIQDSWQPIFKSRRKEMKRLSDLLGDDHDLAVFAATLEGDQETFGAIQSLPLFYALIRERRGELQAEAHELGRLAFAEPPEALADRYQTYWSVWRR